MAIEVEQVIMPMELMESDSVMIEDDVKKLRGCCKLSPFFSEF